MQTSLRTRAADEGGSVMILISISMVMILGFTALTVDIGRLSGERRDLQDVADVVSLDVVRELEAQIALHAPLTGPPLASAIQADAAFDAAIQRSAARNDFPRNQLLVTVGRKDPGVAFRPGTMLLAAELPNAVEATAGETVDFAFAEGGASTTRRAVASREAHAGFSIGSYLASVDSAQTRILNRVLGDSLGIQLVGYSGLVGAKLSLEQIGLAMAGGAVTPNELLDGSVSVDKLGAATVEALRRDGQFAAADALEVGSAGIKTVSVNLRDIVKVGPGGERAAATAKLDVVSLLTGTAFIVDKDHAFTLEQLNAGTPIPGLTDLTVSMNVISPPAYAFGPVGVSAETAQVKLTITPTFALTTGDVDGDMCKLYGTGLLTLSEELECLPLLSTVVRVLLRPNLVSLDVTGSAPMVVTSAEAKGTLTDIECATGGRSVTIRPEVGAVSLDQVVSIAVQPKVLGRTVAPIAVQSGARAVATGGVRPDETFLDPDQFDVPRTVGSTPVGLAGLLQLDTTKIQLGGVKLQNVVDRFGPRLIEQINGALGQVDTLVLPRLSKTLGFSLGAADLTALSMDCNGVRLAE